MAAQPSWPAPDLFRKPWSDLELVDVANFLAGHGLPDEGLTWEAKAGDIHAGQVHKAIVALGNSVLGGYLILGVAWDKASRSWTLPGAKMPGSEPGTWLGQQIGQIKNAPPVDIHVWPHGIGYAALLSVPPAPVPPLIAPSGVVYERVSGASVPVDDPTDLRRLYDRGEAAMRRAADGAQRARVNIEGASEGRFPNVSLGLASVGTRADVVDRLFTRSVHDPMAAGVLAGTLIGDPDRASVSAETLGNSLTVRQGGWGSDEHNLVVAAYRTGEVGAAFFLNEEIDAVSDLTLNPGGLLGHAWAAAQAAIVALGGYGPAHLAVYFHSPRGAQHFSGWTKGAGPTDEELAAVVRQVRRQRGDFVLEDE